MYKLITYCFYHALINKLTIPINKTLDTSNINYKQLQLHVTMAILTTSNFNTKMFLTA